MPHPVSYRRIKSTRLVLALACFGLTFLLSRAIEAEPVEVDDKSEWNGFQQEHFRIADRAAYLVLPSQPAKGKPWVWRARFPNYHAEMDIALLELGYHIAYVDVSDMFGNPRAIEIGNEFYDRITNQRGLAKKPALEGVSRGGLFAYNWAAANPNCVACIYCDTPVCDFRSWPGGKGEGLGSPSSWRRCLEAYGLTEREALHFSENPIDHATIIAEAKIPLLHIVSENDRVVPPSENSYLLQQRIEEAGHQLEIISVKQGTEKSNGHHFEHPSPKRVIDFVTHHTKARNVQPIDLLRSSQRIVFLGDSITYAGQYVALFDCWMTRTLEDPPIVIDVALPSETVSGLSEDGHAGGRFPRPHLAKRLDRVLDLTRPDLVFACYGINCGIYQPLDSDRFRQFKNGIQDLKQRVESRGATFVVITPPCFDDQRAKKSFSYNEVLDEYADWLLRQRDEGWLVVDLHAPMSHELAKQRETNPDFTFQPDAVHPNTAGHMFMADRLIKWLGGELDRENASVPMTDLVRERLELRRDAYLSAAGHERPGIKPGLSIDHAEQRAQRITDRIRESRHD